MVTDADKKAALAELYREGCLTYLEGAVRSETDPQTRRVYESALRLAQTIERVPVLVIPCIERRFDGAAARRHRVVVRVDPARGVELPARVAIAGPRLGVDHRAPLAGGSRGRAARHPRHA